MTPQSVGKKSFHCFFLDPSETNFREKKFDLFNFLLFLLALWARICNKLQHEEAAL